MPATHEKVADTPAAPLDEQRVRAYLQENRDFLQRNPDLLDFLQVSHASGSAISLVEKQVSGLRERNVEMRHRLNTLNSNARHNDKLYAQTRRLVLSLLAAESLATLVSAFKQSMQDDFEVEHVSLILFGDPDRATDTIRVDSAERAEVEIGALLSGRKAVCGALREEELQYLFPDAGAIGSAAIMPLFKDKEHRDGHHGLIAAGSSDPNRYHSAMGTLFLQHIADVLVQLLARMPDADLD